MKVLFYAGGFAAIGGIEAFICNLSRVLAVHDHSVEVLCWGPDSDLLSDIARSSRVRRQRFRWGCRIFAPDLALAAPIGIQRILRHDIIILTKLPPWPLLRLLRYASRRRRNRSLVYVTPYRPQEIWRDRKPAPALLNLIDAIIVQADGFAEDLRALGYRGAIETIPYLPPRLAPPSALPDCRSAIRIGFVGRLAAQKNLLYLLQAFAHLAVGEDRSQSARRWELHLFGDGDQRPALENAALAYGLQKQIFFHGVVPHEAVQAAIDQCHLFAFSSVTEGQCLAALEILARGRPIVATPVGAFPEIIVSPELGAIAPLNDAAQFARALAEVGTSLIEGRTSPQAIQDQFGNLLCHDKIVQKYCSFLSQLTSANRLPRQA